MPIRPFISDPSFDPEAIRCMSLAFEDVCADLRVSDKHHRMTEVVARRIIELAAKGHRDPYDLYAAVIASFKRGE
jgi:hypothetical protein